MMKIAPYLQKLKTIARILTTSEADLMLSQSGTSERSLLMLGRLLCESIGSKKRIASLSEVEFKVFSQWGDDGIIQWLVKKSGFSEQDLCGIWG